MHHFLLMLDWIHLDKKWFLLTWEKEIYLLHPEEKNPKCCIKHKSHITKVMFLCAIVCPRFNPSANSWWDGKLGIWSIGDWELVKHRSKNKPKGTLVWKNKAVTKEVYRELSCCQLSWRSGPRQTGYQEKFSYNKMVQKVIFVRMTTSSVVHWQNRTLMWNVTHKQQTHLM